MDKRASSSGYGGAGGFGGASGAVLRWCCEIG